MSAHVLLHLLNAKCNNALCNKHSLLHLVLYYIRGCHIASHFISFPNSFKKCSAKNPY